MTISETLRKEIRRQYLETDLTIKELASTNGVGITSVFRICNEEMGLSKRNNPNWKIKPYKCLLSKNKIEVDEDYFNVINSNSKAYWLGFIAADGCLSSDSEIPRMSIGLSLKDISHLEKFKNEIKFTGIISKKIQLHKKTNHYNESCGIEIRRKSLYEDLINHGVKPNKSKDLSLPNLSDDLMRHYIRGYFDGDGCWTIRDSKTMCFSLISSVESFAFELRKYLSTKCNLNENVKITSYNNAYAFIYSGNIQTKRFYNYLYEDGGPWLDRKYEKSTKWFQSCNNLSSSTNDMRLLCH